MIVVREIVKLSMARLTPTARPLPRSCCPAGLLSAGHSYEVCLDMTGIATKPGFDCKTITAITEGTAPMGGINPACQPRESCLGAQPAGAPLRLQAWMAASGTQLRWWSPQVRRGTGGAASYPVRVRPAGSWCNLAAVPSIWTDVSMAAAIGCGRWSWLLGRTATRWTAPASWWRQRRSLTTATSRSCST